jgi:hypothetical protein
MYIPLPFQLIRSFPVIAAGFLFLAIPCFANDDPLVAQFRNPPVSAKPQIWWHWMNGNITREGITADLEAMHRVGISEANIITVASSIPPGPVPVMSPQFFDMVEFAAKEAKRLNMTLCMDNCPGWSCSGGPWVTPEHAMQMVTTSETTVDGPAPFSGKLTQPPAKKDFYQDIAVLAFKTPAGDSDLSTPANLPKITTSVPDLDVTSLLQPGSDKTVKLPKPVADHPVSVQIEYPHPVTARTLTIVPSGGFGANGKILTSSDGIHFDTVRSFNPPPDSAPVSFSLGGHPVTARFFQVRFDQVNGRATGITLKGIEVSGGLRIDNISAKASFSADEVAPLEVAKSEQIAATPDLVVQSKEIVDLTSAMKSDGSLTWTVPAGRWTLLRVGYTITGKTNHPAPPEATGLDCDKLSPDGLDASWNGMMQPILNRLGPLAGKVLEHCLIDSYEMGGQNWTPRMVEDFKRLRGYDPTPFLPIMTGRIIDSSEISERFLWDERRTVADLFAQNYYGHFTELCHEHGLTSMIEPYVGPFESLQSGATNDIPMGEFWAGQDIDKKTECRSVKMASSIGHIYGQTVIAAESLTGYPTFGSWMDDPYSLKADGDRAFCRGINRFVFHRFAHQPWTDKYPGMTMGKWGINLDRTNTWWEMGKAWMQYITRSQFLLQQGRSVADVAYFCGQSTPVMDRPNQPALPKGYDFDQINADVLLNRATVVDHRLVLQDGASYAVLVLSESDPEMTPELLAKIRDFVNDGAIVVGAKPDHSPSLQGYPACDAMVEKLAADLWGNCDGKSVTEHALGKGKVIWGQTMDQVLSSLHLDPDFQTGDMPPGSEIGYIHRTLKGKDLYFAANPAAATHQDCTFRISGKVPELWHPDTGETETGLAYQVKNGRTTVPIDFDPSGSVFVVFREADPVAGDHVVPAAHQLVSGAAIPVGGPWVLNFPPNWGAPASATLDQLISWPTSPDNGIKYFSGTATYVKDVEVPADALREGNELFLDLGEVKNLAQVKLNGTDLGILWKPPFRVNISAAAKPGTNHLEISVVNLWVNRLIGDEQLPPDVDWLASGALAKWPQWLLDGKPSPNGRLTFTTWHHVTDKTPLQPSGLLGPVTLQPANWLSTK